MNPYNILPRLVVLFGDTFHIEAPPHDTDLLESGILDSFQVVELLLQLEREFGVELSLEDIDLDDLRTLERVAHLVARHGENPVSRPADAGNARRSVSVS